MSVAELPERHPEAWARATRHDFLTAVADGSMPRAAFDTWLVQDYLFVADLLWYQARLLGRAPRPAQAVLAAGAVALVDELAWFERLATARGLDLAAAPLPATVAYRGLLERLDGAEVAIALAMLWTLERTYLEAWAYAAPGAPDYQEFVAHWTAPEFGGYVAALAEAADGALRGAPGMDGGPGVDGPFREVVDAEARFWDMAWGRSV